MQLSDLRDLVEKTTRGDLLELAAELSRALAATYQRAATSETGSLNAKPQENSLPDLLTVKQVAKRLNVPRSYLYRNWKKLPFAVKLGHRTLRFDARKMERWQATR